MTLNSDGSVDLYVRALASFARIKSMEVANVSALLKVTLPYTSDDFTVEADYLESLWRR